MPHALPRTTRLVAMMFGASQIQAACGYSPPPVPSHGQTAETLNAGGVAVSAEIGRGTVASWWNASNVVDVEQSSGFVGAGRFRFGLSQNVDLGLVGGLGPRKTFVAGPELKWRFSRVAPEGAESMPGFQAAWINGVGVGSAGLRYDVDRCDETISEPASCMMIPDDEPWARSLYVAPYTGLLVSAGTNVTQLYTGARFALSEALGNDLFDMTLYPSLGFGGQLRPTENLAFYAETDFGAALPTTDFGDTGVIAYFALGATLIFDRVE
jgi:hypothetical protein